MKREVESMILSGVIEESQSKWYNLTMLASKPDKNILFCIDFRMVNVA